MKRLLNFQFIAVLAASSAFAAWVYEGQWGTRGSGNGQFDFPLGVAVTTGKVYVADVYNNRVQYFTATGAYLGQWGSPGSGNGQFRFPFGVAVGPEGKVFVVDKGNCRIQYFTATGAYLGGWGSDGKGKGQFNVPYGVCVNVSGSRVYASDLGYERIQYFKRRR